jgi:hypothetical protein
MNAEGLRDIWLPSLERWHRETRNPLYAWEAIALCLNADPAEPIPTWCVPYLADAAGNITDLAWGCGQGRIKPDAAGAAIGKALGLSRQGFNAFTKICRDREAMRAALDESYGHAAAEAILRKRSISTDRARRIVTGGKRLLRG